MTLYDYIQSTPEGEEITVWDNDYDIEVYFYNQDDSYWDHSMMDLAKKLNVVDVQNDGVIVDLYDLIDRNIDVLDESGLFNICETDAIMDDIESILAGYVSENWLRKFVDTLV